MMSASVRVESEEKEYKGNLVIDPLCGFLLRKLLLFSSLIHDLMVFYFDQIVFSFATTTHDRNTMLVRFYLNNRDTTYKLFKLRSGGFLHLS